MDRDLDRLATLARRLGNDALKRDRENKAAREKKQQKGRQQQPVAPANPFEEFLGAFAKKNE